MPRDMQPRRARQALRTNPRFSLSLTTRSPLLPHKQWLRPAFPAPLPSPRRLTPRLLERCVACNVVGTLGGAGVYQALSGQPIVLASCHRDWNNGKLSFPINRSSQAQLGWQRRWIRSLRHRRHRRRLEVTGWRSFRRRHCQSRHYDRRIQRSVSIDRTG